MTSAHQPMLQLSGVTKRFGGLDALLDIDLTVNPGQIYSIIGPNGAGKTTVFYLANCSQW
jgi:branched-chain amino acid transport system ATP-binding protein